jgi:LCP family protein required for cell wall assembly
MWERLKAWRPTPRAARWIVAGGALVVLLIATPFLLWNVFGPDRFDDLAAGPVEPEPLPSVAPDPQATPSLEPSETISIDDEVSEAPPIHLDVLAPDVPLQLADSVRVTLVFSVGSQGITAEEARRLRVNDFEARGRDGLTDTMFLLVADTVSKQAAVFSLPRDLWLYRRGHRINETFNRRGTQEFVQDVSNVTGLPIHHVVRVNFVAFANLVDRIGGVALNVDRPLADLSSVLYVPQAGCWRFDGAAALAHVRSRHTLTRQADGDWVNDVSASDIGRMGRQRDVLGAAWERVRGAQLIPHIPDLLATAREGLVVDPGLGLGEVRDLAAAFEELSAGRVEAYVLPTYGQRIGRAAAQLIDQDAGEPIARRLRSWPPSPDAPPEDDLGIPPTIDVDPGCNLDTAVELPLPDAPLASIAAGDDPVYEPAQPSEEPPPPSEAASDAPTPSEPAPSDAAS